MDVLFVDAITGDVTHFGPFFGCEVAGVLIVPPPAHYFRQRDKHSKEVHEEGDSEHE